jgi:methoxymalonate biosynthesis acyl carrier protein
MENNSAKIKSFLSRFFRREVEMQEDIFGSGIANSLFLLQLIMFLERDFGVRIESADLEIDNFRTVTSISALIQRKTAQAAST